MSTDWTSIDSVYKLAVQQERTLGSNSPELADILSRLGDLHFIAEDFAAAEPLYWRVLSIRQKMLGESHKDTATTLQNLAELYEIQDRYAEAQRFYHWSTTVRKNALLKAHSDKVDCTQPMGREPKLPSMHSLKDSKCSKCNRQLLDEDVCMYCTQGGFDATALLAKIGIHAGVNKPKKDGNSNGGNHQSDNAPVNVLINEESHDRYQLDETELTIGRHPKNSIVITSDKAVSRNHATIKYDGGHFYIVDCKTMNGTFVNSEKIEAPTRLRRGDIIAIGGITLKADFQGQS